MTENIYGVIKRPKGVYWPALTPERLALEREERERRAEPRLDIERVPWQEMVYIISMTPEE